MCKYSKFLFTLYTFYRVQWWGGGGAGRGGTNKCEITMNITKTISLSMTESSNALLIIKHSKSCSREKSVEKLNYFE